MTKIAGSGSGSISQRHESEDPDPYQNVKDSQHCLFVYRSVSVWSGLVCVFCCLSLERMALCASRANPSPPITWTRDNTCRGWNILYHSTTPEHKCTPGKKSIGVNKELMVSLQISNLVFTPVLWIQIQIRPDPKLLTGCGSRHESGKKHSKLRRLQIRNEFEVKPLIWTDKIWQFLNKNVQFNNRNSFLSFLSLKSLPVCGISS